MERDLKPHAFGGKATDLKLSLCPVKISNPLSCRLARRRCSLWWSCLKFVPKNTSDATARPVELFPFTNPAASA